MNHKRAGIVLLVIGAVLILSALLLYGYNLWEDARAGAAADDVMQEMHDIVGDGTKQEDVPDMPVVTIHGYDYIGYLNIPDLDLELPIIAEWSYDYLKRAPCRHLGSTYGDDLVIAGHNYKRHFGRLKDLEYGAVITFTDMDGVVTTYTVAEHMLLEPTDVERVVNSEYELILYTCTYDGDMRTGVGCEKVE